MMRALASAASFSAKASTLPSCSHSWFNAIEILGLKQAHHARVYEFLMPSQ
jgi:hypothetical protein